MRGPLDQQARPEPRWCPAAMMPILTLVFVNTIRCHRFRRSFGDFVRAWIQALVKKGHEGPVSRPCFFQEQRL